jgi:hypothetical protein
MSQDKGLSENGHKKKDFLRMVTHFHRRYGAREYQIIRREKFLHLWQSTQCMAQRFKPGLRKRSKSERGLKGWEKETKKGGGLGGRRGLKREKNGLDTGFHTNKNKNK